ncbi:hypothetical protein D3Z53_21855 [Lachnospiraceae bacterium]|jgi:hypothetical protein|nr:hypothetical protein [uncultured Schaedlerella sp.]NBI60618.1 hypothetical protein [Lachnospiraceae bacterium]
MENSQISNSSSGIRKTKFTCLKDQQCSLNMQIRLAMQLHNNQVQEELEKKLEEVTKQLEHIIY